MSDEAKEFHEPHGRIERTLKRNGFLQEIELACADWKKFANSVGEPFCADTLSFAQRML